MTDRVTHREATPLGVFILGRKRPGFDQEWNRIICQRSVAALEALGYRCVGAESQVIDDTSLAAMFDKIEQAGCEALVMLQPSMGHGQLALSVAQRWPKPVILWATPERPGDGKVSSCSLVGQHLWGSALRQAGHPFEFVYGDPDDAGVVSDLKRAIALGTTFSRLRKAKVGVVGTHAPGFIDLAADPFLLRRTLGVQLNPLSLPQFIERVHGIAGERAAADVRRVKDMGLRLVDVDEDALEINSRCYLAMQDLMEEESLTALALQCWPELPNMLGQWPYLAVARLTAEERAVAIEGDVDGAISLLMNIDLGLGASFLTDWLDHDRDSIFFWHPGMAPLTMCNDVGSECGPALANHFNIVKPLVVDAAIRNEGAVTMMRLWRCDERYHLTAFEGRTAEPPRKLTGNSVRVVVEDGDVRARFDGLLHAGMPHHVLLAFGSHAETFRRLARLLRLEWHG